MNRLSNLTRLCQIDTIFYFVCRPCRDMGLRPLVEVFLVIAVSDKMVKNL